MDNIKYRKHTTHFTCQPRIDMFGGEGWCCLCVPHDNCSELKAVGIKNISVKDKLGPHKEFNCDCEEEELIRGKTEIERSNEEFTNKAILGFLVFCLILALWVGGVSWHNLIRSNKIEFNNYKHDGEESGEIIYTTADNCFSIQTQLQRDNIVRYIREESVKAKIDPLKALEIAYCESKYDPNAASSRSSAKGIYQFTDATWKEYCVGDVFMPWHNIDCFMQLYPKHPDWWQCRGK